MFQPSPYLSPTKNKSITSNSHTFQHMYKDDIQKYYGILFQQKLQQQNEQIWKDVEEKDKKNKKNKKNTVPINQFVEEEIEFV